MGRASAEVAAVKPHLKQLHRLAQGYAAAEMAVIAAFFRKPRKPFEHLHWLRAQAYKEYSAIKPIFSALAKLYPELDRGVDRREFEELTEKLADETRHARLVMDLIEAAGEKDSFSELPWLPEDRKLARVRGRYSGTFATLLHGGGAIRAREIRRKDEALERAAITLTEGGGGALYRVCSQLKGGAFERKIARAFSEILADETEHKDAGIRSLNGLVTSRAAFLRAAEIISEISQQRLRMRNEQFGFPLSDTELSALERRARQILEAKAVR
jgi:hypothetical protein